MILSCVENTITNLCPRNRDEFPPEKFVDRIGNQTGRLWNDVPTKVLHLETAFFHIFFQNYGRGRIFLPKEVFDLMF